MQLPQIKTQKLISKGRKILANLQPTTQKQDKDWLGRQQQSGPDWLGRKQKRKPDWLGRKE